MLATLHSPIRSADEILQIAREQREETPHLEFKAFWGIWCKQEKGEGKAGSAPETAKDVAAFANSEGGDILVGISTSPATGRASGFIPQLPEVREPEDELRKQIRALLAPAEVAETVRVQILAVQDESTTRRVAVVTIPPWPHGVVGVRSGLKGEPDHLWRFPRREGSRTIYLSWEDVMRWTDPKARRLYLHLRELLPEKGVSRSVRFGHPLWRDAVGMGDKDQHYRRAHPKIAGSLSGEDCDYGGISVRMDSVNFLGILSTANAPLYIPFDVVDTILTASWENRAIIDIILAHEIVWMNDQWRLIRGASRPW